ncbi:MAG: putative haloacid dehalogenase-like hydrolase family protein [Thermoleophilia bacterium]|nr:putative haloacid dehalogenase-like hydrolase family protein [Thermoleophilia bacterium]
MRALGTRAARSLTYATAIAATVLMMALVGAPSTWALNFTVSQNAELQLGAPAGAWTSKTYHSAANMAYGMYAPNGVTVDSSGSVYVADTISNRLMRWGATPATDGAVMTNVLMKSDASQASWNITCSGGADRVEQIMSYGTGSLAIADRYSHRVVMMPTEQTTDGPTGTIFLGQSAGNACGADRGGTAAANTLDSPSSVWTDGIKVAVADSGNHRVLLWDSFPATGQAADHVLGQANFTSVLANRGGSAAANTMNNPKGVWFDGSYLYVTDSMNNRVLIWSSWPAVDGAPANNVLGQTTMTGTSTTCAADKLSYPSAVTTTGTGAAHRLAISAEHQSRVAIFNAWPTTAVDGASATSVLGQTSLAACNRNRATGVAAANSLDYPAGISFEGTQLWVADVENHRVLRFPSLATGTAANRVLGHTTFTANTPMDGTDDNVFQMVAGSTVATSFGTRVATAANGMLVALEPAESALRIWSTAPVADNEAFSLRYGQAARDRSGMNGPSNSLSASTLFESKGVWTDGTKLLVADTENDRVLVWLTLPTTDTDSPDYVLGQPNFTSSSGAATQTGVDKPTDVTSDGIDVFVSEKTNDRVLIYRNFWLTPANGKAADRVLGQSNFTSFNGGLAANRLDNPYGVSVDSRGRLAVADQDNHRVLVWNDHTTVVNGQAADVVIGQANFTSRAIGTITENTNDVQLAGGGVLWDEDCSVRYLDPLPTSGSVLASSGQVGIGCSVTTTGQNRVDAPSGVTAAAGKVWVSVAYHGRLMRWVDATAPTITVAPTATVRCDGTATISWTTSESTTTEIRWDTVTRASWVAGYANQNIDPTYTGLTHTYDLSFATPGTKFVRVRAEDWNAQSVISSEISFTIPATCPAPTTMFGDDLNAQAGTGRLNPSATSSPAINSTAFHTSWSNVAGVTMDRQETATWTTPPEHAGGVWHLDSSTAADTDGQSTNAVTWTGLQPYAPGRFGTAATFAADGRFGTVADAAPLRKANDFTLDLWFNTTNIGNDTFPMMVDKSDTNCGGAARCNYSLEWDRAANKICAYYANTSNALIGACSTAVGLLDGQWHYAAMTVTSTNALRLYVDGVLTAGPTASAAPAKTGADQITIGRGGLGDQHFRGSIDEVRFAPVAYDAGAILGYFRTRRAHLEELWTLPSTALGANCTTATRCEDRTYAGAPEILRQGARYWQRSRYNTVNNDYWTDQAIDWFETTNTTSINVSVGGAVAFGSTLPGADAFGSSTIQVSTNAAGGYQLLARDESDTWGLERIGGGPTILDRQDGVTAPAPWNANVAGFYGLTVRSATGNRLAKWGTPPGGFAEADVSANNLYTALEGTSDVLLHERQTYDPGTDSVVVTWRANPGLGQAAGSYDGVMTLTAVANP